MPRWEPDAVGRLQEAALALFGERGFEQTTVAEIATRAGLTKRTFFRHFVDKREVLFRGSGELQERLVSEVATAADGVDPLDVVIGALDAVATMFEQRRAFASQRQHVIAANPELQERERIKLASLAEAVAQALRLRGVGDPAAILAAETGITVFRVAFERWVEPSEERTLQRLIRDALHDLRGVVRTSPVSGRRRELPDAP